MLDKRTELDFTQPEFSNLLSVVNNICDKVHQKIINKINLQGLTGKNISKNFIEPNQKFKSRELPYIVFMLPDFIFEKLKGISFLSPNAHPVLGEIKRLEKKGKILNKYRHIGFSGRSSLNNVYTPNFLGDDNFPDYIYQEHRPVRTTDVGFNDAYYALREILKNKQQLIEFLEKPIIILSEKYG